MSGDCSVLNTAADNMPEDSEETEAGSVIVLLAMQSGGTVVCLLK